VVAIYNGVSAAFTPRPDWEPYSGGRPLRILAVGTLQPRKNLVRLVEAADLLSKEQPVSLRVIGPDGFGASEIRGRLRQSLAVEITGWVGEEELAAAYRDADVFAYPSIYEGFGLPVVEAMASGTPVVTSTGGSLPEVAGDAALIVDPLDTSAIVAALRVIASDPARAASLRSAGLVRARLFSWETAAEQHAAVYRAASRR
jgi:glycosyltransferase involved in cell wall biosynthesis